MIVVIKPGILMNKRFRCSYCGCVFKADEMDYKINKDNDCYCVCPTCKRVAFEDYKIWEDY